LFQHGRAIWPLRTCGKSAQPFLHQPLRAARQHGFNQPLLGAEVIIDRGEIDLGRGGDLPDARAGNTTRRE
jgi:hypothetical protein